MVKTPTAFKRLRTMHSEDHFVHWGDSYTDDDYFEDNIKSFTIVFLPYIRRDMRHFGPLRRLCPIWNRPAHWSHYLLLALFHTGDENWLRRAVRGHSLKIPEEWEIVSSIVCIPPRLLAPYLQRQRLTEIPFRWWKEFQALFPPKVSIASIWLKIIAVYSQFSHESPMETRPLSTFNQIQQYYSKNTD